MKVYTLRPLRYYWEAKQRVSTIKRGEIVIRQMERALIATTSDDETMTTNELRIRRTLVRIPESDEMAFAPNTFFSNESPDDGWIFKTQEPDFETPDESNGETSLMVIVISNRSEKRVQWSTLVSETGLSPEKIKSKWYSLVLSNGNGQWSAVS